MSTLTEVRFAHEDGALADTLDELPDVDVRVLPETSTDPGQVMYVMAFENADERTLEATLRRDHTVSDVRPMPEFEGCNLWGVAFDDETKLLGPRVTRDGGFVVDARSEGREQDPRGWHERWLLPDREAAHNIWTYAREEGFEFDVLDLHRQSDVDVENPIRDSLTDQQRAALLTAYERGYFAEPREASLEAVADALGHSPSAAGGRIKRGMKSLIETTLAVDYPQE
jgi:hypothetical protein